MTMRLWHQSFAQLDALPVYREALEETLTDFCAGTVTNVLAFLDGRPINLVNPPALPLRSTMGRPA